MAWTAPSTYVVGQIVTAAILNTDVRDNLNYLKGNAGLITISNGVDVVGTVRASGNASPSAGAGVEFLYISGTGYMLSYDRAGAGSSRPFVFGASTMEWDIGPTPAMYLDASLNLGIGTVTPAGRLHAKGAGGSFLFLSANAVTSLQTLAPNGTALVGMVVWLQDRNNGAGASVLGMNGQAFSLTSALTYVNTDTITVTLTAAGAITVQRTTGTNGSHQINMMCLVF